MNTWARSMLVTIAVCAVGCGNGTGSADGGSGDAPTRMRTSMVAPSGAACPPGSTLTYESFAEGFFGAYCVRCHSSTLTSSSERNGAPLAFDFDTHAGAEARADEIDTVAAGGPTRINVFMPPNGAMPSDAERDMLGEWLACGAP